MTQIPLNYNQWLEKNQTIAANSALKQYTEYILQWYKERGIDNSKQKSLVKADYIQLIKDLNFLFSSSEKDSFLKEINYDNDEELILAIPHFASKLKDISKNLVQKREAAKASILKYNSIGSNKGLENLLYDYFLKAFTKNKDKTIQFPTSQLQSFFPELSTVKDNFYIEIEELYDSNAYHDSDPSNNILEYINLENTENAPPFANQNLSENEILGLLSTRFLPKVAETPLSLVFKAYLTQLPTLSTDSLLLPANQTINNKIIASQKYLGETVYGLTAVRLSEINEADAVLNLKINAGNNWFLWPSGNTITTPFKFTNFFEPIYINDSNFINSGATGGIDYTDSDLIFTDKNGFVEGAWLKKPTEFPQQTEIRVNLPYDTITEFIFPFVGFELNSKGFGWKGYAYNNDSQSLFNLLPASQQEQILTTYFTGTLPNSSSDPIYLNQTSLREKAFAGIFSDEADILTKQRKQNELLQNYNDSDQDITEQAYLYKFIRMDVPIDFGETEILWPLCSLEEDVQIPVTLTDNDCLPIRLADTNPVNTVKGAVAGTDFNSADIIFKLDSRNGEATEAAWLRSGSVRLINFLQDSIPVYDTPAIECAVPIEGPVQNALFFKANPNEKISFIWAGKDTPADKVFKFYQHSRDCPYYRTSPHNYYRDQDYINPVPLKEVNPYSTCNCKSVNYSPIGHSGDKLTDYNSVADYLFADPQGLGNNFAINSWKDTRGFNAFNSPQFAFYKLTNNSLDKEIGWGEGYWKTGNNTPMILKAGRRYTYYRTNLRRSDLSQPTPYFVINYAYEKINSSLCQTRCSDIVFVLDASLSQTFTFDIIKDITKNVSYSILEQQTNNQIGVVSFKDNSNLISFLTKDPSVLDILLSPQTVAGRSNLPDGIKLASSILTTRIPEDSESSIDFFDLCRQLNATIISSGTKAENINIPQPSSTCKKRIVIFSDGEINEEQENFSQVLKEAKSLNIEIISVNIGLLGTLNDNMREIASSGSYYFNLQDYLERGDGDVQSFAQYLTHIIVECPPIEPTWYKATKQTNGTWINADVLSDLVIKPGDYVRYVHRPFIQYVSPTNPSTNFTHPSITFTMNYKLDGWDYSTNSFSLTSFGKEFGAKPFWGISFNIPNSDVNFNKETITLGGNLRFFNDYTPVQQPIVSSMILNNGSVLKYHNRSSKNLLWEQTLNLKVYDSKYQWNALNFYKEVSHLKELLNITDLDKMIFSTNEPSNILLESYSQFKPAQYNYYARNNFTYIQNLYDVNRCLNSFAVFNSAIVINPLFPYANLDNRFYPTIASVELPKSNVSEKQVGEYLLPDKLGTSTYRGRGYNITVDRNKISFLESLSAERMFLSPDKYAARNRGLTKKDQLSPVSITNINNSWVMEPYSTGDRKGIILGTRENQKFIPYQSNYEIHDKNYYGISRQEDSFQFWTPAFPATWNNPTQYPLTFRNELPQAIYKERINKLQANKGTIVEWKQDLFGFDYALYKRK